MIYTKTTYTTNKTITLIQLETRYEGLEKKKSNCKKILFQWKLHKGFKKPTDQKKRNAETKSDQSQTSKASKVFVPKALCMYAALE